MVNILLITAGVLWLVVAYLQLLDLPYRQMRIDELQRQIKELTNNTK